jgi:hypothetical protein
LIVAFDFQPFDFAHETPAFVLQSSDYGVAGMNHAKTNQKPGGHSMKSCSLKRES